MTQAPPEGFHTLTPHLVVNDAAQAIQFYTQAFGAQEVTRIPAPDGKRLLHAQLKIGDSPLMLCDMFPEHGGLGSPKELGGTPVTLHMYVSDVDAAFKRATEAGAEVIMPVSDMFWGDRYGKIRDPFGHEWSMATPIKGFQFDPEAMAGACVS